MESDIPQMARGWTTSLFALCTVAVAALTIARRNSPPALLIFVPILILLITAGISILSTVLTYEGVSQRTWRGWTHLRWQEVRAVRLQGKGGVVLEGPGGKVTIPGPCYRDYDKLLAWLAARLPHVWPK